ncbi:MAG TPA: class I SAM-dependent rRNA methyltransferase [Rhizomicrobium sp.]|jgi:23S rRNA (cytosine1962-C5)-methyltransferase
MVARPLIRLRPREGRRARAGAPWIFSNEIAGETRGVPRGSLVETRGDDGFEFGAGYYNPGSLIAVRLLEAPAGAAIGREFFAARIGHALAFRERMFGDPFYRLVNAEGDRLPGLVIDRFDETCVVQITSAGMELLLAPLLEALDETLAPRNVVLRADSPSRSLEGLPSYVRAAKGDVPAHLALEENGARYFADLSGGQKTGWYYDQRDNRAFIAALARGRSVLDAYCHSGGFALAAAGAGAREICGLDSSAAALSLADDGATANGADGVCKFVKADALEELDRLGAAKQFFDIAICDPPPFVKSRKDIEAGARVYRKLAKLAARVVATDGLLLLASCSHNISMERFQSECAAGIARAGRRAALIRQAGAAPDHPVHPMLPETAYLKALVYSFLPSP